MAETAECGAIDDTVEAVATALDVPPRLAALLKRVFAVDVTVCAR